MLPPGPERMRRLRYEGEKAVQDALMIPDTLPALMVVAKAAEGLPWVLAGSLAASCWMESRATVVIEILVADDELREIVLGRVESMPQGYEIRVRVAADLDLAPVTVRQWHARARRDRVGETVVHIPQPEDLFLLLLAEPGIIEAPRAMSWACRLQLLHGPWECEEINLSPYLRERWGEATTKIMNHTR